MGVWVWGRGGEQVSPLTQDAPVLLDRHCHVCVWFLVFLYLEKQGIPSWSSG